MDFLFCNLRINHEKKIATFRIADNHTLEISGLTVSGMSLRICDLQNLKTKVCLPTSAMQPMRSNCQN